MSDNSKVGTLLGFDGCMQEIRVGDYVQHLEKEGFGIGVVREGGRFYKGEAACVVDFENEKNWLARLSRLEVVEAPEVQPTLADFGFKVGDRITHKKYAHLSGQEITSEEIGTYKDEPCCYIMGGRPTRFSQIEKYVEAPKVEAPAVVEAKTSTLKITLPNGKIIKIDIE